MRRHLLALTLLAAAATTGRAGPDDELANARAEFDVIVRTAMNGRRVPRGPSMTKRVRDLLLHDPAVVRRVETEALDAVNRDEPFARSMRPPIETTIRFLHGLPTMAPSRVRGPGPGLFETAGGAVVVHGPLTGGARFVFETDGPLAFQALVAGKPLRQPPVALAADLLAKAAEAPITGWSDGARMDLGTALGEACADDSRLFDAVVEQMKTRPDDPVLLLALGWSSRAAVVPVLAARLSQLAAGAGPRGGRVTLDPLRAAATALDHADPGAFARVVAGLSPAAGYRAVEQLGFATLVHWRLEALDRAADAAARRSALSRLCDVDALIGDVGMPPGADAQRLVRALLSAVDSKDAAMRRAALNALETLLYAFGRYPIRGSTWSDADSESTEGESIGSYAGAEAMLRLLAADLDAGRIELRSAEPGIFERRVSEAGNPGEGARSDIEVAADAQRPTAPLHVAAEWTKNGLRLRLRNAGDSPIAIDPVGMRYGRAELVTITKTARGRPPVTTERLRLSLGFIRSHAVIPARFLVVLEPGATHDCELPVREDQRVAKHVDVSCFGNVPVVGDSATPVLRWDWTTVR